MAPFKLQKESNINLIRLEFNTCSAEGILSYLEMSKHVLKDWKKRIVIFTVLSLERQYPYGSKGQINLIEY